MSHHDHEHHHAPVSNKKVLFISFIIIFSFMIIEAIGGYLTNSLALLSDAGHMLSDAVSLAIALMAFIVAERASSRTKTYGFKRIEILAALLNGITLIGISIFIIIESIDRFMNPPEVATTGMLIISMLGLVVNIIVAIIMVKGSDTKDNLNMRGAYLHVISDMLGSIGAILAALLIIFFDFGWADPLASVIVAVLILRGGFSVTKNAVHVLMEGTPNEMNHEKIQSIIKQNEQVISIHDLHVWTITSGLHALTCHLVVDEHLTVKETTLLLEKLEHDLLHENIQHVTLQIEGNNHRHDNSIYCTIKGEVSGHHHHHH